jgi:hypothetical protein
MEERPEASLGVNTNKKHICSLVEFFSLLKAFLFRGFAIVSRNSPLDLLVTPVS